ncbi:MAG: hypothetical protein NVS4B11_29570 [Ktedonobacteraceae bacterium]
MIFHKRNRMQESPRPDRRNFLPYWLVAGTLALALLVFVGFGTLNAQARLTSSNTSMKKHQPVVVTVFSPGKGDKAGIAGAGNVIDLALDAATPADNTFLSAANGYKPFFNVPGSATFHPGFDPGAPGLVVLLSTTKTIPGTPFQGPGTNLAGLFQINGVASVNAGTTAEVWSTWQIGKPIAGVGVHTMLTVFVVSGTAPTIIHGEPEDQSGLISNIVQVPFTLAG